MALKDELQGRLGDIPLDISYPPPNGSGYSPGYDTTGTRRTTPGAATASVNTAMSSSMTIATIGNVPGMAVYAPIIALLVQTITDAILEKRNFLSSSFAVDTTTVVTLRPKENRGYLLIQNNSAAVMYLGVGYAPTAVTGIQIPAGGNYEPAKVPQDDIYILGSAAAQAGVLLYAAG